MQICIAPFAGAKITHPDGDKAVAAAAAARGLSFVVPHYAGFPLAEIKAAVSLLPPAMWVHVPMPIPPAPLHAASSPPSCTKLLPHCHRRCRDPCIPHRSSATPWERGLLRTGPCTAFSVHHKMHALPQAIHAAGSSMPFFFQLYPPRLVRDGKEVLHSALSTQHSALLSHWTTKHYLFNRTGLLPFFRFRVSELCLRVVTSSLGNAGA